LRAACHASAEALLTLWRPSLWEHRTAFDDAVSHGVILDLPSVLSGVLSAAVWEVAVVPAYAALRDTSRPSRFDEAASHAADAIAAELCPLSDEQTAALAGFLSTGGVRALVRAVYYWRVDRPDEPLPKIEAAFALAWRGYAGELPEQIAPERVFALLLAGCEQVLDGAISSDVLGAHEAKSAARHRALLEQLRHQDTANAARAEILQERLNHHEAMGAARAEILHERLRSIERQIERDPVGSGAVLRPGVAERVCAAVAAAGATIAPPSFHATAELPLDEVFVRPFFRWRDPLRPTGRGEGLTYPQLVERLDRVVLLGAPGAGKSTLAQQLCRDLALGRFRVRGALATCPMPIVLREYAAAQRDQTPVSVRDYLVTTLRGDLQLDDLTEGELDGLLWSGSALILFDGLDEVAGPAVRQRLRRQIEAFAERYPVRVVVTSRIAGYDHVPLSPDRFAVAEIAPFDEGRTRSYVTRWLTLQGEPDPRQAAAAFMAARGSMGDLWQTPLTLALICVLARQGGVPESRIALYERCAQMLYREWDRRRAIEGLGDLQDSLRPVLCDVALWLLQESADDLPAAAEDRLQRRVRDRLAADRYDGDAQTANDAAWRFVDFCRGRAWIFSDTAMDERGIPRFGFTHRSFLEYFAAEHLVTATSDPERLAVILRPRIERDEWGVVSEIAAALLAAGEPGAVDRFVRAILPAGAARVPHDKVLGFAVRLLDIVELSEETIDAIVERVMFELLSDLGDPSKLPRSHFQTLDANAAAVRRAWARQLSPLMARTPVPAADLLIRWPRREVEDSRPHRAAAVLDPIARADLLAHADTVFQIAYDCCVLGLRDTGWLVRTWGAEAALRPRVGGLWGREAPLLELMLAERMSTDAVGALVGVLATTPAPWFDAEALRAALFGTPIERFVRAGPPAGDPMRTALWTLIACAAVEDVSDALAAGHGERITRRDGALLRALRHLARTHPAAGRATTRALDGAAASGERDVLPRQVDALVAAWAAGNVSFVAPRAVRAACAAPSASAR
jgi:hypothetical protein